MPSNFDYARRIQNNLKMSSDTVTFEDCYKLCADKSQLKKLVKSEHQVIWGRRGTGKTTLQKAFTYYINELNFDKSLHAIYIMIAKMIPTYEELEITGNEQKTLPVYIFTKLIAEIVNQLEKIYESRQQSTNKLKNKEDEKFVKNYIDIIDIINNYRSKLLGLSITIDDTKSVDAKNRFDASASIGGRFSNLFLETNADIKNKFEKTYHHSHSLLVHGTLRFAIDTQTVSEKLEKMLEALKISRLYISIDEYSEIDKVSEFSIQSDVAQLIKQVFFKSSFFSIKIATIWSNSKLHKRGENRVQGIEYKQDIFPGPDLDIMFMKNNDDVVNYFKTLLVNTYALNQDLLVNDYSGLKNYFVDNIFGSKNFQCLICGSQGVSRSFVVMVSEYLNAFLQNNGEPLKISIVYDMIKNQYLEDVRPKLPYLTIGNCIEEFIREKETRYFLISRNDYYRCKSIIKQLASKGAYIQLPGHLTNIQIRNKYKLFIINYGNYLEVIENQSYKKVLKTLTSEGNSTYEDVLFPPCPESLLKEPTDYCVVLPENAEKEIYCPNCQNVFLDYTNSTIVDCPKCRNKISKFDYFANEVSPI